MNEKKKLAVTQAISGWTLRESEKRPSELFRLFEAEMIGRLARDTALAGLRFDGWPTVRLDHDDAFMGSTWRLHAEVTAK